MGVMYLCDIHKKRSASLARPTRKVHVTKFIDLDTLAVLGIDDVMKKFFHKMEAYLGNKAKIYVSTRMSSYLLWKEQ